MTLFDDWQQQQLQPPVPASPGQPITPASNGSAPPAGGTLFDAFQQQQGGGNTSQAGGNTAPPAQNQNADQSWSDLPGNIPGSAMEAASGLAHTVAHPIDTLKGLYHAGASGIAQYFIDRYGSWHNAEQTFIKDPVGALMDLSMFATGPEGAAVKLAGSASKIGKVATAVGKAGRMVDPLAGTAKIGSMPLAAGPAIGKVSSGVGKLGANVLGASTSAGSGLAVETAAKAGFKGGADAKTFASNITGKADPEAVAAVAQQAARNAHKDLTDAYGADLNIIKDVAITDPTGAFRKISNALDTASGKMGYTPPTPAGAKSLPPLVLRSVDPVVQKMADIIADFAKKDPRYFTIGGFNKLKQDLGGVVKSDTRFGTPAGKAAGEIYDSVKEIINNAHPLTAKMASDYSHGFNILKNIEKTFSLGGTPDTIIRKLGSTVRSGVHANLGARVKALGFFAQHGGDQIINAISGQTLRPMFRSGLVAQGGILGAAGGFHFVTPWATVLLAAFSPRLVGRAAFASGKLAHTIVHPILAVDRAMRAVGIKALPYTPAAAKMLIKSPASKVAKAVGGPIGKGLDVVGMKPTKRGVTMAATQAGKISEHHDMVAKSAQAFRSALEQKAKSLGYNLSPRVLNQVSYMLLSEDPNDYAKGIQALGNNKRLMEVITAVGTKGEK